MSQTAREHKLSPGSWPNEMPYGPDGRVEEGLVVWSLSGNIEGRTTGARLRCFSIGCPGWFIGVNWETGQRLRPCSQGWRYDPVTKTVRVTGGGEISARFVAPAPLGTPPLPREQWPPRESLANLMGWRVTGEAPVTDDDVTNTSIIGRLLEEISWEGSRVRLYRDGGRGKENVLTAEG